MAILSMKIEPEAYTQRNINNEGWSQYVIENNGAAKRRNVIPQYVYEINRLICLPISL
jgi:hypothetical protein